MIEEDLGEREAGFEFSGRKDRRLVLGVGWFERWFAGEDGGAAVVGRQPPSSLIGFGRGLGTEVAEQGRAMVEERDTRVSNEHSLSLSKSIFVY